MVVTDFDTAFHSAVSKSLLAGSSELTATIGRTESLICRTISGCPDKSKVNVIGVLGCSPFPRVSCAGVVETNSAGKTLRFVPTPLESVSVVPMSAIPAGAVAVTPI
uniref:hypothetical protein n=1 Tax=Rhodococcus erythropolis TaxID=1833 RepID=UPI00117AE606|nr:hypothetical protein [Rhodococcus erythropolis]